MHTFGVAMLLEPEEIHQFNDIGYVHDKFQTCPGNAINGQLETDLILGNSTHDSWDKPVETGIGCRCRCDPGKSIIRQSCSQHLKRAALPRGHT